MTALVLVVLSFLTQAEPPMLRLESPFAPAGTPFTAATWNRLLETARASRTDAGYWAAVVRVDSIVVDSTARLVTPYVSYEDGPLYRLGDIRLEGNVRIRADDLDRAWRPLIGLPANRATLNRLEAVLSATGWFSEVGVVRAEGNPEAAQLVVAVRERPLATTDALVGYAPGGDGWMGYFDLGLRHAFGVGTEVGFRIERLRPFESRLEALVRSRWFGAEARFFNQDSTFRTTEIGLGPRWELHPDWTLEGMLTWRSVSAGAAGPEIPEGTERRVGIRVIHTEGLDFRLTTESSVGIRESESDAWRTTHAAVFVDWTPSAWALRLRAQTSEARIRAADQAFRIGGAADLRGYREAEIRTYRYVWSDVEYRWGSAEDTQLFVFGGGGYADRGLWSAGFGFRYPTPLGRMELTYGGRGLVHVRLSGGR